MSTVRTNRGDTLNPVIIHSCKVCLKKYPCAFYKGKNKMRIKRERIYCRAPYICEDCIYKMIMSNHAARLK